MNFSKHKAIFRALFIDQYSAFPHLSAAVGKMHSPRRKGEQPGTEGSFRPLRHIRKGTALLDVQTGVGGKHGSGVDLLPTLP